METKTKFRFFTIADFTEEEEWLREEHKKGWQLVSMKSPGFYHFEKCEPEDIIYKLDYKNGSETKDYMQMFEDYGWEYITEFVGWLYFRKPAKAVENDNDAQIFSDQESQLNMLMHVGKTRLLPIALIFFVCVLPNATEMASYIGNNTIFEVIFSIFWYAVLVLYLYIFARCGIKIYKIKKELEK